MRWSRARAVSAVLLSVALVGGAAVAFSLHGDGTEAGEIPDHVTGESVNASAISVEFTRTETSTLFRYNSHDAVILDAPESGYHLIAHNSASRRMLFRSVGDDVPTDASAWEPIEPAVNGENPGGSIDTAIRVNGTYYAYQDGEVYTSSDLSATAWNFRSDSPPGQDHGVYHEDGVFHLFYEAGERSDHSGAAIGHATSPNGIDNWTVRPPVYRATDEYKVGDFEVVKRDGVYLMFGDYTVDHPRYSVSLWANDNLYTNFTRVGTVLEPSGDDSGTLDGYGIQDADVVRAGSDGRYVLFAHGHTGRSGPRFMHTFEGRISVGEDALESNESSGPGG